MLLPMVSLGLVHVHSDVDAWSSSNQVDGYVIASTVHFFVGLDIGYIATVLICGSIHA